MKPGFDLIKLLLTEMKFLNVIKDGNIMEWYSPFKQYKFEIERSDNQLWYPEQYEFSKYLISLKISDMLGIPITEVIFNEIDACRILDSMDAFITQYEHQTYSDIYIYTSTKNPTLSSHAFYLQRLNAYFPDDDDQNKNNQNWDNVNNDIRDILLQIKQFNPIHQTMIDIVSVQLSDEELYNLMYAIYFVSLIDICDLPDTKELGLENVVTNLVHQGYI